MPHEMVRTLGDILDSGNGITVHCQCGHCKEFDRAGMEALIAKRGREAKPHTDWFPECSACGEPANMIHLRLLMYDPGEEKGPPIE